MRRLFLGLCLCLAAGAARADEVLVAVAANFAVVLEALAPGFEAGTGHRLTATTGSTGKLYAQIVAGAPFDVLLSADQATPVRLGEEGAAAPSSRFTYATGELALWSADPARLAPGIAPEAVLRSARSIALANPDLAPYGIAARETLQALGLWQDVQDQLVVGQNVGQTQALVATGAAEIGFVAASSLRGGAGSRWQVPADLHAPIRQDAILLVHGLENAAAAAFLDYLRSDEARAIIARFGYGGGG